MDVGKMNRYAFVAALTLGLALRILWAVLAPSLDPKLKSGELWGDAADYHHLALSLIQGKGFSLADTPTAFRPPAYPLFLAGVYLLSGPRPAAARMAQALLGAAVVALTFFLARRICHPRPSLQWVPVLSSLMVAVHPLLIYSGGWLYGETLCCVLLLSALLAGLSGSVRMKVLAGFLAGASVLARPQLSLVIPGIALSIFFGLRGSLPRRLSEALLPCGIAGLLLLAWTGRNALALKAFVPLTTSSGANLLGGNNPNAHGGFAFWPACPEQESPYSVPGMAEADSDRFLRAKAYQLILQDVPESLSRLPAKMVNLLSPVAFGTSAPLQTSLTGLLWAGQILFLSLALLGVWIMRSPWRSLCGVYAAFLGTVLSTLLLFGTPRFMVPVLPLVCLFAGALPSLLLSRILPCRGRALCRPETVDAPQNLTLRAATRGRPYTDQDP